MTVFYPLGDKYVTYILSHRSGSGGRTNGLDFKFFHDQFSNERPNGQTYGCTMDLSIVLTLEKEIGSFKAKLQPGDNLGN